MFFGIEASHAVEVERTGVGEACWQIIENLKKIIPSTTRVVLYSHQKPTDSLAVLPFNWEWKILSWPLPKLWSQLRLAFELLLHPPDVFFAPGQIIPWYVPQRTTVFIHDSAFLFVPAAYRFWGRQYLRLMNWYVLWRARFLITSSEFNKQELIKYYGSAYAAKILLAPLACDSKRYNLAVAPFAQFELKKKWQIEKPFVLFIGRLETKKNVLTLIKAFNRARLGQNFQLVLAGRPGYGYTEIKEAIKDSPFCSDIKEIGWISTADLARLLRSTRGFLFPSQYEGFGLPVLEAMSTGCPVVVGDQPALREVSGEAAKFIANDDLAGWAQAMIFCLIDSIGRDQNIKNGIQRAMNYSWAQTATLIAKYLNICYDKDAK